MTQLTRRLGMQWTPARPRVLVVACSDGRLQEATDAVLADALNIHRYDRLYVPGGGGALSSARGEFSRAHEFRRECRFLVDAHHVDHLVLLFHGPAADGPSEAVCADYRRLQEFAPASQVRTQQAADVRDLIGRREEFGGAARLSIYRLEVTANKELAVITLHEDLAAPSPSPGGQT
jgi:hypothetical protein